MPALWIPDEELYQINFRVPVEMDGVAVKPGDIVFGDVYGIM